MRFEVDDSGLGRKEIQLERREKMEHDVYVFDGDYGYECISTIQVTIIQWSTICVTIRVNIYNNNYNYY